MKNRLKELFIKNKGYLTAKQIGSTTMRYHLNKMIKNGEVSKIRRGLYILNNFPKYDERELVAELIPNGVFCMFSAWEYHKLTTTVAYEYHIAISRKSKISLPEYPRIKLYYWSDEWVNKDIIKVQVNDKYLKYYNPERSVCDAVRLRNKIGEDILMEVVKSYLSKQDKNLDLLIKTARNLKIENVIANYIKILL